MTWVVFTFFASLMQAFRTAGQKKLAQNISAYTVTYVRFIFGLPFVALLVLWLQDDYQSLELSFHFYLYAGFAALCQICGTYLSVLLLGRRNFVAGSTLVRSETLFAALLGAVVFSQSLTPWAWVALVINVAGILMASIFKRDMDIKTFISCLDSRSAFMGLLAGVFFAVAALLIREASHSLTTVSHPASKGIFVLFCMLMLQTILSIFIIIVKQPYILKEVGANLPSCGFIGLTSMLGSTGWFIAYSMQSVAYVKMVGQIEFLFISLITIYYFKETVSRYEWIATSFIVLSIFILFVSS